MHDELHEHAMITANAVKELRDQVRKGLELNSALEARIAGLESENCLIREQWNRDKSALEFYQSYSVELTTQINVIRGIFDEVVQKAEDASYAKGVVPKPQAEIAEVVEKLPTFLTPESKITQIPQKKIERKV